mgnify:FL=1
MSTKYYTVSELTSKTRSILELSLDGVWVEGEISNLHYHSSGHIYLTLKDKASELRCVFFKHINIYLGFRLQDGMHIQIFGGVSIYEQRGQLQFLIQRLKKSGSGALYQEYQALKNKLEYEGLFLNESKKQILDIPNTIGIVTSEDGAAFKDILNILNRRSPFLNVIIRSAKVQGEGAANDISNAIVELSSCSDIDTIIIGRGGGSIEDLWAFNEEILARTIFDCKIPIISAVGHETDYTISDFVADLRAATPSEAAELVSISSDEISQKMLLFKNDILSKINHIVNQKLFDIENIFNKINILQPINSIATKTKFLKNIYNNIIRNMNSIINNSSEKIENYEYYLKNLDPKQVLERGYSIAFNKESNKIIRSSKMLSNGERFYLKTGSGSLEAEKLSDINS